ncbi:conserved hypothetical protein [Trichinella spiralis]|uniref:hypothetical protein n=1 Tax=Trichinella spiralis TaxID=6334 RepID=UPI0001EFD70C|nr:conserved hypothetical protein [Trichinella spiralis]
MKDESFANWKNHELKEKKKDSNCSSNFQKKFSVEREKGMEFEKKLHSSASCTHTMLVSRIHTGSGRMRVKKKPVSGRAMMKLSEVTDKQWNIAGWMQFGDARYLVR